MLFVRFWTLVLVLAATSGVAAAQSSCPRLELARVESSASAATRPVKLEDGTLFVQRNAITTTSDIAAIRVASNDIETSILIKYNPEAAARLLDATTNQDGLRLAFVVDDDVLLAFTWEGTYGIGPDGTQLTILHGSARTQRLIQSIRDCTLGE